MCNSLKNFFNIIFSNKYKIYNNEDLLCNIIEEKDITFNVIINKFIYRFTYYDFIRIINNSLLHYTCIENSDYIDNIFISPVYIKNPYTNINFNINVLYNFYIFCINNNKKIPLLFKLFYYENFNLKNFFLVHEIYIVSNAYKIYIKNCDIYTKHANLLSLINTFVNFISKYIKNFSIKYLLTNYKLKFYNLTYDETEYYNYYLHDYMMLIYFYKKKQYKYVIDYKLKIIFNLLYDKNIKVIDPLLNNLFFNKNNETYIIDFLIKNLKIIISNELYLLENSNNLILRFINETTEETGTSKINKHLISNTSKHADYKNLYFFIKLPSNNVRENIKYHKLLHTENSLLININSDINDEYKNIILQDIENYNLNKDYILIDSIKTYEKLTKKQSSKSLKK